LNLENALVRYKQYGNKLVLIPRNVALPEGNFINAIIGPRRAGKTSLMLLYKKKLDTAESNKIFINCEDIDFVGITVNDLDHLEEAIFRVYKPNDKEKIYLFIDEAQNFPEWPRWLRTLYDQGKYRIFITGSTSDLSLDNLPSELRGRAINTMVLPFSFKEYLNLKQIPLEEYPNTTEINSIITALSDFLDFGGYPEVAKSEDQILKHTLLSELYATVIQRDLIEKYGIRKTALFRAFVNSLFGSACRNISISSITKWFKSQGTNISYQTALNYISYTQAAFLFFLVYPYSRKIKERNTKPKLYVADSGILGLFEPDIGKKIENTVLIELIRRRETTHYYRTSSSDVDFLLTKNNKPCELIQVCYSINEPITYAREINSLLRASEDLDCNNLTVVTFNEEKIIKQDAKVINIRPLWKWLHGS
jgi:Predicted ATPase (AAA+ superfamily)